MSVLCIDLKSFYASCECVKIGVDPFKYPLVVANKHQGQGAMALAITPFLRSKGIKSRCRLYEIPKNVKYKIANPNFKLYEQCSKNVIDVFLKFVSKEDLHTYSIDECFLDLSKYKNFYKKNSEEIAKDILKAIHEETGLTAACGIGPNVFISKLALDLDAKKRVSNIAKWDYETFNNKIKKVYPLSQVWGIGKKTEKKLNNIGLFTVQDILNYDPLKLKNILGVNGLTLYQNLSGVTTSTVAELNKETKTKSISHSKVFLTKQTNKSILPYLIDMIGDLTNQLRQNESLTKSIKLQIEYENKMNVSNTFYFEKGTNNDSFIYNKINYFILNNALDFPIRKISISFSNLIKQTKQQLSLFDNKNDTSLNKVLDKINEKNKIYKSSILLKKKNE